MELRGDEIVLRAPTVADVAWIVDACRDPVNQEWLPMLPTPYEREHAEWWVRRAVDGWADGTVSPFVVEDAATAQPLGVIEVRRTAAPPDVGYWLAPWARGRGAMTRALRLLVTYAFEEIGLERLELYTMLGNTPSQRVAERAGFTRVGVAPGHIESRDGERFDAYVFVLERPR